MSVSISASPLRLTISLSGEIDHHTAALMRIESDDAIQGSLAPNVRFDFRDVTFIDSSAVGFVLGRYRIVKGYGGNVEVVNLTGRQYSMMKLAGLEKMVTLKTR